MSEKKKFILAVPTVIIIIIFIVTMCFMIYNKNYKPLTKEEAMHLAERAVTIDNLSCQIMAKQEEKESVVNYKRKGNMVYRESDGCEEYLNIETSECVYIDEENKEAYKYISDSVIESYNEMIYIGIQSLKDENVEYKFKNYEKVNGIDCAAINLSNENTVMDLWLDRENGMVTKFAITYKVEGMEDSTTTYIYRYQIGKVTDENITVPDLSDYVVMDM